MASENPNVRITETENSATYTEHKTSHSFASVTTKKMQLNDADTEASANIAGNTEMLERVPEDKATDTAELRRRIESFSNQPVARSPSFLGESERSHDIHNRTGSVGAARRPSFIKGQEGGSTNQHAVDGRPDRNHKRRIKAINKATGQDTNGATSMTDTVPENQNKNPGPVNVESSNATGDEYVRINNKTADPDNNQNELSKHLRHDSSSSSESTCQSGGSMSSYDADPEFPFPKEVSGI